MPLSLYQASVPMFAQTLAALSNEIDKASVHYAEQGLDTGDLMDLRLAPDMMSFAQQIQQACHHSTLVVARLAQVDQPLLGDTDTSLDACKARIAASLAFFDGITPAQMDGAESRRAEIQIRVGPVAFEGQDLLLHFSIPQTLFHATTAHGLLRNAGVDVMKVDFLGDAFSRKIH